MEKYLNEKELHSYLIRVRSEPQTHTLLLDASLVLIIPHNEQASRYRPKNSVFKNKSGESAFQDHGQRYPQVLCHIMPSTLGSLMHAKALLSRKHNNTADTRQLKTGKLQSAY